jgi:hypothetical protein
MGKLVVGIFVFLIILIPLVFSPFRNQSQAITSEPSGSFSTYLPFALKEYPVEITIFGIETYKLNDAGGIGKIDEAGATWTRRNAVEWDLVEPIQGARDWGALAGLEAELVKARNVGLETILIVRSTPAWAQAISSYSCGMIKPDNLDEFAVFMHDLVARYSVPPYEIKYWEIWNEPDVAPTQVEDPNGVYGCWGDPTQPNFGGDYFAEMLEAVYPQIKLADPNAKVVIGGLLLDCDPGIPGACTSPYGGAPSRFLTGILSHSGANDGHLYFDGVAIHAYDHYENAVGAYGNTNWGAHWNTTGPVSIAKNNYVEGILDGFGITDKFILNTESALIGDCCPEDPAFELTKAYYVAQSYSAALAEGFTANIWFNLLGWRNSSLVYPNLSPRLAYQAFTASRSILQDAAPLGLISSADISPSQGVAGYKFSRNGKEIWILWSRDGVTRQISLIPGEPNQTLSVFGTPLLSTATPDIRLEPTYFLWN